MRAIICGHVGTISDRLPDPDHLTARPPLPLTRTWPTTNRTGTKPPSHGPSRQRGCQLAAVAKLLATFRTKDLLCRNLRLINSLTSRRWRRHGLEMSLVGICKFNFGATGNVRLEPHRSEQLGPSPETIFKRSSRNIFS